MKKYTQKELRRLVSLGVAVDITNASDRNAIPEEYYIQVGYSHGIYGCNGRLFRGCSGKLYAITSRTQAIYIF